MNLKRWKWLGGLGMTVLAFGTFSLLSTPTSQAQSLDMDAIFRCHVEEGDGVQICAEGREIIVNHCTACHTFIPIVLQQFDAAAWQGLLDRHRPRASGLNDEQFALLHEYLSNNFNEELPPPEVPPEMLNNWTSY